MIKIIIIAGLLIGLVVYGAVSFTVTPGVFQRPTASNGDTPTPVRQVTPLATAPTRIPTNFNSFEVSRAVQGTKWEYFTMEKRLTELVAGVGDQPYWLEKVGKDGWELIYITEGGGEKMTLIFKKIK